MKTYRSRVCQNAGCCELARVLANAATMRQVNAHPPVALHLSERNNEQIAATTTAVSKVDVINTPITTLV